MSKTSAEQPEPGTDGTHGDPLMDSAQGRGDVDGGSRHGLDPADTLDQS